MKGLMHLRQGIEPGDQRPPVLAIFQPAIHLDLEDLGEGSNFAFGAFVHNFSIVGLAFIWFDMVG